MRARGVGISGRNRNVHMGGKAGIDFNVVPYFRNNAGHTRSLCSPPLWRGGRGEVEVQKLPGNSVHDRP